jgi:DNA-binding transcriptional regulator LsrR (DeoR family)
VTSVERLRLMTRVARLYYEHGLRQPEIAKRLSLSQAMVSRLLNAAHNEGIVRTTVMAPAGVYPELEEELALRYDLKDVVVADCALDTKDQVLRDIGSAAATYLETTLGSNDVIGISSWSETLLRMVASLPPLRRHGNSHVVQILGGIGKPNAEAHAIRMTEQLASLLKAEPHFLSAPGVTGSPEATAAYLAEPLVQQTTAFFGQLTVALVGIGSLHPSRLLGESGNVFSEHELGELEQLGAVGDVCLRFFDAAGDAVSSRFDGRVIGLSLDQLRDVSRSVGVAGTMDKLDAIRGALEGRLINVLITDRFTAERLAAESPSPAPAHAGLEEARS